MLLKISEDMTEENLCSVKFLSDLPRAKLETSTVSFILSPEVIMLVLIALK